jgi:hypothetical protein
VASSLLVFEQTVIKVSDLDTSNPINPSEHVGSLRLPLYAKSRISNQFDMDKMP